MRCVTASIVSAALAALALPVAAQSGGGYTLTRNAIAGGGETFSSGDGYVLAATIGQADAGVLGGSGYVLSGGFWTAAGASAPPTPSRTAGTTPTASTTGSAVGSATATPVATTPGTGGDTPTASATPSPSTQTPVVPTPTFTPTATPGTPAAGCVGDCNGDAVVAIGELIRGVNIALGNQPLDTCPSFDSDADGRVTIPELIRAVTYALASCPA